MSDYLTGNVTSFKIDETEVDCSSCQNRDWRTCEPENCKPATKICPTCGHELREFSESYVRSERRVWHCVNCGGLWGQSTLLTFEQIWRRRGWEEVALFNELLYVMQLQFYRQDES